MYLERRNRILRTSAAIRSMVAETSLSPNDFIAPLFIDEGKNVQFEIPSMPGYYRRSLDLTINEVKDLWKLGIKSVLLFIKAKDELKDKLTKTLVDKKLLVDPIIAVRFLNFKVTVLGEVAHPTVVTVPSESITLLEALGLAGS